MWELTAVKSRSTLTWDTRETYELGGRMRKNILLTIRHGRHIWYTRADSSTFRILDWQFWHLGNTRPFSLRQIFRSVSHTQVYVVTWVWSRFFCLRRVCLRFIREVVNKGIFTKYLHVFMREMNTYLQTILQVLKFTAYHYYISSITKTFCLR